MHDVTVAFMMFDTDNSGTLDRDEFKTVMKARPRPRPRQQLFLREPWIPRGRAPAGVLELCLQLRACRAVRAVLEVGVLGLPGAAPVTRGGRASFVAPPPVLAFPLMMLLGSSSGIQP